MIRTFQDDYGVQVLHAWGMTEMSPLGTAGTLKASQAALPKVEREAIQSKQGRAIFGVDYRIVDENGSELPWDGKAFGDLQVRGPWVIKSYFKGEGGNPLKDGSARSTWRTSPSSTRRSPKPR
jgi:acyl-CoA synthetase (AMP-forming)/AMP-acid ligase II